QQTLGQDLGDRGVKCLRCPALLPLQVTARFPQRIWSPARIVTPRPGPWHDRPVPAVLSPYPAVGGTPLRPARWRPAASSPGTLLRPRPSRRPRGHRIAERTSISLSARRSCGGDGAGGGDAVACKDTASDAVRAPKITYCGRLRPSRRRCPRLHLRERCVAEVPGGAFAHGRLAAWDGGAFRCARPVAAWHSAGMPADPLTLIVGDEELLAERAVGEVIAAARADDRETEVIDLTPENLEAGRLAELTSPSLFVGGKVLVLRSAEDLGKELIAEVLAYAERPADDVALVAV